MTPNTTMTELSEKVDEMLAGLDGVTPGPWIKEIEQDEEDDHPAYYVSSAVTTSCNLTVVAKMGEASANDSVDAAHIARCDPDTMRQILTLAKQALSQSLRAPAGEAVAWRWRERGNKHWIYDPKQEWVDDNISDPSFEFEPLYASPPSEGVKVTDAARDVMAERQRQVEAEGWTPAHDDAHDRGEMAAAAGCYALGARLKTHEVDGPGSYVIPEHWPWDGEWWKPGLRRRDLVKAAALLLAEIERLDRLATLLALQSQEPK